ncbi:unnamed protein product [Dracunculus medinensis]|uniref:FABP domain-containing protein n=1 Tax=Dracunculus medinensis TaxID=318479 RepID=A0A0N4UBS7_DRAME|nr:unnamed protein product [Dracunculus medinensis]
MSEKFFGTFHLERSENFDQFLASKGVNWFIRKMIQLASVTKVFAKSKEVENAYDMSNLTSKKDTIYKNWKLNETFEDEGLDGGRHQITFNYDKDCDCLMEKHIRLENPDDKGETYYYTIENDMLVLVINLLHFSIKK